MCLTICPVMYCTLSCFKNMYSNFLSTARHVLIFISINLVSAMKSCLVQNSTSMLCFSPAYPIEIASCAEVTLGFMLDGIQLLSWSESYPNRSFSYCLDSVFTAFDGEEFVIDSNTGYVLRINVGLLLFIPFSVGNRQYTCSSGSMIMSII